MNELGLVRVTEDIDLLVEPSIENQEFIRHALRILPERAIDELGPEEDLRDWVVVRVNDEITVDLMTAACDVTYSDAKDDVTFRTIKDEDDDEYEDENAREDLFTGAALTPLITSHSGDLGEAAPNTVRVSIGHRKCRLVSWRKNSAF